MRHTPDLELWLTEVWNNANEQYIYDVLHPNVLVHGLHTDKQSGVDAFVSFYKNFREQFPAIRITHSPIMNADGFQAAECIINVTDTKGVESVIKGVTIARFEDGKLTEGWNGLDFADLYK